MIQVLFYIFAAVALGCALGVVLSKNPVASLLFMVFTLGSLAAIFVLFQAHFLAAIQVIVYAGAIMVLFVFVIMLLNAGEEARTHRSRLVRQLGAPLIVMLMGLLVSVIYRQFPKDAMARFGDFPGQTAGIGLHLFLDYLLPFEVVSILILVAIIGAVVLARKET